MTSISRPAGGGAGGGITRRRALALFGAAAGLSLAPAIAGGASPQLHRWTGTALGATASMTLAHHDAAAARSIFARCEAEIARLERVFSLHIPDSEIVRLNRDGILAAPSHDLVRVLAEAERVSVLSDGAFDVTIQPLWRVHADHFAAVPESTDGPDDKSVAAALSLVDHRGVEVSPTAIRLARPGMAITLNGIAQGYVTDRVAKLMRREGIERVLLDLGENLAVGSHPEDRPWRIGVRDPRDPDAIVETLDLTDRAVATSGGYGTPFSRDGRFHHLLDPRTGSSAAGHASVTVVATRAMTADALSTAIYVAPPSVTSAMLSATPDAEGFAIDPDGRRRALA